MSKKNRDKNKDKKGEKRRAIKNKQKKVDRLLMFEWRVKPSNSLL
jgi:hypothetical protein